MRRIRELLAILILAPAWAMSAAQPPASPAGGPQNGSAQAQAKAADWEPAQALPAGSGERWWRMYQDPQLDSLEGQVRVSNENLPQAEASWREGVAAARATGPGTSPYNVFSQAASSWELELWRTIDHRIETGAAKASNNELAGALLSAQTTLAVDYIGLRLADEQKQLLAQMVSTGQSRLDTARSRYKTGTANNRDVLDAQVRLEETRARLLGVDVQRLQLQRAIAQLSGATPAELSIPAGKLCAIPVTPPQLDSSLLERRPDITAALQRMQASGGLRRAQPLRFPSLMLAGESSEILGVVHSPSSAWPGAATGIAGYRQTVLGAMQQVEDELATGRILAAQHQAAQSSEQAALEAVKGSVARFKTGQISYTEVLDAQAAAYEEQQVSLIVHHNRLVASVLLVQGLGGDWSASLP